MSVLSAQLGDRVRRQVLEPTMDARALNLEQDRRIACLETVEVDSGLERTRALRAIPVPRRDGWYYVNDAAITAIEDDWWFVAESNGREGQKQRIVAGAAEGIGSELHFASGRLALDYRNLARELRVVLRTIAAVRDPTVKNPPADQVTLAWAGWRHLLRQVPADRLTGRSLLGELGRAPTRVLLDLLAESQEGRAA